MTIAPFFRIFGSIERMKIIWRVLLASVIGFILLSVFIAGGASIGSALLGTAKASLMLWLMLIGIVLYCCLVMWVFASNKLMRCSLIILVSIALCSAALYTGDMLNANVQQKGV